MSTTRILLVEDCTMHSSLIIASIKQKLEDSVTIELVESMKEATGAFARATYDLIILDLILPDSSGFDTLSNVKSMVSDVPVIVCTGMDDCKIKLQSLAGGASAFIKKGDGSENELAALIVSVLWQDRKQSELSKSINRRLDAIHSMLQKSVNEHEDMQTEIAKFKVVLFGDENCMEDCGLIGQVTENTKARKFWTKMGWLSLGGVITLATSGIIAFITHVLGD